MESLVLTRQKGFTLVELLLYVSIASIVLLATSVLLSVLLMSRVKNQTIAEVEQQGTWAMQVITQDIRNAASIQSPGQGATAAALSLSTYSNGTTPTTFDASGGALRITQGSKGTPMALTNSRVTASGLTFVNASRTGTPGVIQIFFTLSAVNPSGTDAYQYTQTFESSAALRQP